MALDAETLSYMRLLLSDEATPYTFEDETLETAVTMFSGLWCRAAAFLARRKAADLSRTHKQSVSMGATSVSTADPSMQWKDMAASIETFCTMLIDTPELLSFGPEAAGSISSRPAIFDLWMHANPAATADEYNPLYEISDP